MLPSRSSGPTVVRSIVLGRGSAERTELCPPTFVFDEVDAGVGGRAALDVGARLAALAEHSQVIVVTHLAQVAAFADRHLVVHKADDGRVTSSSVTVVEGDERLRELSRMMGGDPDSEAGLAHASDLVDQTAAARATATLTALDLAREDARTARRRGPPSRPRRQRARAVTSPSGRRPPEPRHADARTRPRMGGCAPTPRVT